MNKYYLFHLQIIVMSATMDVDHFSHYFNNAPVLYIEGRQFPIRVRYFRESKMVVDTQNGNTNNTKFFSSFGLNFCMEH